MEHLEGLDLYFSVHKWKMSARSWVDYPKEIMNELTTLEETKPATCIILVE